MDSESDTVSKTMTKIFTKTCRGNMVTGNPIKFDQRNPRANRINR